MGVVLSAHAGETFAVETEDERLELRLEKARRRFEAGEQPHTRYRFAAARREAIPVDPEAPPPPGGSQEPERRIPPRKDT